MGGPAPLWRPRCRLATAAALIVCLLPAPRAAAQDEAAAAFVRQLEDALMSGSPARLVALTDPAIDPAETARFASEWMTPGLTRVSVRERDRLDVAGGTRLLVEVLLESGASGRVATWEFNVRPSPVEWRIHGQRTLSTAEGLLRLSLDTTRQYRATNLVVRDEDLELRLPDGSVFFASTSAGPTVAVLVGRGEMTFRPAPAVEQGQIALFAGEPALRTRFEAAFLRLNPGDRDRLPPDTLSVRPVDQRDARRASDMFADFIGRSYSVDLGDLSRDTWSLVPPPTDFLAEIDTRRFGSLTYVHSNSESEDITLFDRRRRRNISVYPSKGRLAARGRFFDEDDTVDYDVTDVDIETTFSPDRLWFDGRTRLRLRIRAYALTTMTVRLAEGLFVRGVSSAAHGRLLHLRVRNQNAVVVTFPETLAQNDEVELLVSYAGRLEPQSVDTEAAGGQFREDNFLSFEPDPSYLYSNRSYWHAQAPVTDYATGRIRMTVPQPYTAVCSGQQAEGSPVPIDDRGTPSNLHVFAIPEPARYLGCLVGRFEAVESRRVELAAAPPPTSASAVEPSAGTWGDGAGQPPQSLALELFAAPRQRGRGRQILDRAEEIVRFYGGLLGDLPYPALTLAVVEANTPGGHSPPYFAAVHQPVPSSRLVWRDDPASFASYPEFFLAHEIAHQWWGQAVGWENYHEQWLSEAFSQYFAALYAQHSRGRGVFDDVIGQFHKWSRDRSDQGPVWLGYRLGHVKGDTRIFRALVYNKGAAVLHMLRGLLGDDAFFRGLRRYYRDQRFRKAGTEDLRRAFELETNEPLERFFQRWIYEADYPTVEASWDEVEDGAAVVLRVRQKPDRIYDFPLTAELRFRDGTTREAVVRVRDAVAELRVPIDGRLRSVEFNRDRGAIVRID